MKRKSIPAIITLTAGLIASIAGILARMGTTKFMTMLLVVLVSFYILGNIVKFVLDLEFNEKPKEEAEESEETAQEEEEEENSEEAEREGIG